MSTPTWNDRFDLSDGPYAIWDIQDYFKNIIKKHETTSDNPHVQNYTSKIKNRIVFKIKTDYKLKSLSLETRKLIETTKKMLIEIKMEKMYEN